MPLLNRAPAMDTFAHPMHPLASTFGGGDNLLPPAPLPMTSTMGHPTYDAEEAVRALNLAQASAAHLWQLQMAAMRNVRVHQDKLVVVLDLDETLVYSRAVAPETLLPEGFLEGLLGRAFPIRVGDTRFVVFKRPGLEAFLEWASARFELVLFTAAQEEYTRAILAHVDPENRYFSQRFFRQHTTRHGNCFLKDLRVVNRCMTRMVLVDDSLASFVCQPQNGVPIRGFQGDPTDEAFVQLSKFLSGIDHVMDVREITSPMFQLARLITSSSANNNNQNHDIVVDVDPSQ